MKVKVCNKVRWFESKKILKPLNDIKVNFHQNWSVNECARKILA